MHHVGYVTASIAASIGEYAGATSLVWDGQITHDPLQMASVAFLRSDDERACSVELVEPAGHRSPVKRFLETGGGLHHICMEVIDLPAHIAASTAAGCTLVRVPLAAVAFGGRKVAWITTPTGQLIELLSCTA